MVAENDSEKRQEEAISNDYDEQLPFREYNVIITKRNDGQYYENKTQVAENKIGLLTLLLFLVVEVQV